MSIDDMSLDEAMGDKWRPGVHYVEQAQARISILAAEVRRLRAERDELRAAADRLLKERQSGLASLDAWVQLRAAISRTEDGGIPGEKL